MAVPDRMDEQLRALGLVEAQRTAQALFTEVVARGLVAPGRSERAAGDRIGQLAGERFGTAPRHRGCIVRSGPHAALPYGEERPDRVIGEDDLAVVDLGPLLGASETDFARTVVLGDDPANKRLHEDLPKVFAAGREAFHADSALTAGQLHAEVKAQAAKAGWALGGWHAGRLVGTPSAPNAPGTPADAYLAPGNDRPLRRTVQGGWRAHWILEIHLIDEHHGFGGSYKQLLDLV
ncbi:M24 family metallopeptidase [Streptomyces lunalinharesii]|uniref:M24 family metallopeptidase n=1 Tax=Streptomyces lunalinharesii TaxID=333384 RepID=A0ABN3RXI0_9ACTN